MTKEQSRSYSLLAASLLALLIAWLTLSSDAVLSAANIWLTNEIFNHGFLVIPAVAYFIYLKRFALYEKSIAGSYLAVPLVFFATLLYVLGEAGEIELFKHTAAFSLLPLLIWALIGTSASLTVAFPLLFTVFAIPVGEQLIPILQEIAADISVAMLKAVGVPLFRSGLYIEIPNGRFLVAEACSGISFFIASVMLGSIYAYLNFVKTSKRIIFMVIAIVFPIIANAIRVFGIILVGYLSDMEHAVGADHLIYGWFFFAIVLACLLLIGEFMRDKEAEWEAPKGKHLSPQISLRKGPTLSCIFIMLAATLWIYQIDTSRQRLYTVTTTTFNQLPTESTLDTHDYGYTPALVRPSDEKLQYTLRNGKVTLYYQAWFNGKGNELISGLNRLYDEQEWTLVEAMRITSDIHPNLPTQLIAGPTGERRLLSYWYQIDNHVFVSKVKAKLYETQQMLLGNAVGGTMHIVTIPVDTAGSEQDKQILQSLLDDIAAMQ